VTVTGEPTVVPVPVQVELAKNSYVTVPPAWNPPARVEESVTEPPTVIVVADNGVVMVGLALLTVSGSHAEVARLLLASPEYNASKLYDPAGVGVTEAEIGIRPFVTVTVEMTVAVPAQAVVAENSL
jgi:hypothetical protein